MAAAAVSAMTALALAPPPNTPEWEAWRAGGIGASEIPAILGEDTYITERALALEKRGLVPRREPSAAMDWGKRVEEMGASLYMERKGLVLTSMDTVMDPRWPRVFATPDRRVEGQRRLVELKWTNRWSEPPRKVVIQCQAQMLIADADVVDVVVMGPYGEPHFHEIERVDADAIACVEYAQEWYERFVEGDELPPVDGSEQTRKHLERFAGNGTMQATDEQTRLMESLRAARHDKTAAEAQEGLLRNLLTASMAGVERVEAAGWHITWKQAKGATRTDWKLVAQAYRVMLEKARSNEWPDHRLWEEAADDQLDALVSLHSNTGEPTRPFKPQWTDEEG